MTSQDRRRRIRYVFGAVVIAAMLGEVALLSQQRPSAAVAAVGGPFALEDTSGRRVTEADLRGKPTVLFFGYTLCPDVCPTTLTMLTEVMQKLGSNADRLNVVFVTIDPQRDTPAQLKLYLSSFDPRIRGFTGPVDEVARIARAYHARYRRVSLEGGGYAMEHTAAVVVVDAAGRLIGSIPYGEDEKRVARLLAKLSG